jgi:secreted Zn-dependent insulinase-like peptidase
VFKYIEFVKEAMKTKDFHLFDEMKLMSNITFDYYKVPDPLDNVQALADEMALLGRYPERYPKLIMDTYEDCIFEKVDIDEVYSILDKFTY